MYRYVSDSERVKWHGLKECHTSKKNTAIAGAKGLLANVSAVFASEDCGGCTQKTICK